MADAEAGAEAEAGRPAPPRLHPDRAAAIVVTLFAATAFAGTFAWETVPAALMEGLGAVEWPRLVAAVIGLMALALVLLPGPPAEAPPAIPARGWWTAAACALFLAAVALVGMLPAMLLFLVGVGWLWGERRPVVLGASAAGLTVAIWLLFVQGFGLRLPGGLLGEALS